MMLDRKSKLFSGSDRKKPRHNSINWPGPPFRSSGLATTGQYDSSLRLFLPRQRGKLSPRETTQQETTFYKVVICIMEWFGQTPRELIEGAWYGLHCNPYDVRPAVTDRSYE